MFLPRELKYNNPQLREFQQDTPLTQGNFTQSTKLRNSFKEPCSINTQQSLVTPPTNQVLEKLMNLAHERRRLASILSKKVKVLKANLKEKYCEERIVGVDAGRNGSHLQFAFVPIYGAVAVLVEDWNIKDAPISASGIPDIWTLEIDPDKRESLLHLLIQYHVAAKSIEFWKPSVVLIDGSLLLNLKLLPNRLDSIDYLADFTFSIISVISLIELCKNEGVLVAGFIKRSNLNEYGKKLKLPKVRDSLLLNSIMKVGEYTEPFLLNDYMSKIYRKYAMKAGFEKDLADIYTFFVKTSLHPPYRVEIPSFCLDRLDELLSILILMATPEGIPYPIYEAHKYSQVSKLTSNLYIMTLYENALSLIKDGKLSPDDLDIFIPRYDEVLTQELMQR